MASSDVPPCGYARVKGLPPCPEVGDHFCEQRAQHFIQFCARVLVHTKGKYAGKPFILADWQERDIARPVFGTTRWSEESQAYKRQYVLVWIEIARKNGKSELMAAMLLFVMLAEGEESGEIFNVARVKEQAALVFDVAKRMVQLSPRLSKLVRAYPSTKRIVHHPSNSVYKVIAADGEAALGSNPSAVGADEILGWRKRDIWDAMITGMGSDARLQAILVAATTAGNDKSSFGYAAHQRFERVAEDPSIEPTTFVYMRNTPQDADVWDESNWKYANPALGDFLSLEKLRNEATNAKNDPMAENAFRQFFMNQWVSQAMRWMVMDRYDACSSGPLDREALRGRKCYAGFDLAGKMDMTAWCLVFPGDEDHGIRTEVLWRFWMAEEGFVRFDKLNEGRPSQWVRDGFLTVHDGAVIDYDAIFEDIAKDAEDFLICGADGDEWSSFPVIRKICEATGLDFDEQVAIYKNDYTHMSPALGYVMEHVKKGDFDHHDNPVAAFCFDSVEVVRAPYDPELIRPVKPSRAEPKRIDGVPAAAMAMKSWRDRGEVEIAMSAYHRPDLDDDEDDDDLITWV